MGIKQVWITQLSERLFSLTMESAIVDPENMRIRAEEMEFPEKPTKRNPLRHTCNIGLLSIQDLKLLRDVISKHIEDYQYREDIRGLE